MFVNPQMAWGWNAYQTEPPKGSATEPFPVTGALPETRASREVTSQSKFPDASNSCSPAGMLVLAVPDAVHNSALSVCPLRNALVYKHLDMWCDSLQVRHSQPLITRA
jgi:hypothetical protein